MRSALALLAFTIAGCGTASISDDAGAPVDAATSDAVEAVDGAITNALRQQAAATTATSNARCTGLGDFYWEIGDASGKLGGGQVGTTYGEQTVIEIASASKFVFGAYMIESTHGQLSDGAKSELRMLSGYSGLNPKACAGTPSVSACLDAGSPGPNYTYSAAEVGKFHYNGAHDQFFAATATTSGGLGIGADSATDLDALIPPMLGNPGFVYAFPEFAGGLASSAAQFGIFLRAIVANTLLMHDFLGVDSVCTLPGTSCPTSVQSPCPLAWHYSYNHWVEDDPTGDGSFSSAGAFGFYPWISADKTLWGVLARKNNSADAGDGDSGGGGFKSAACGKAIRAAWRTAQAQ